MADSVKPKRAYHSPVRAQQREATRRRVLEVAAELFAAQGYARTTVEEIASRANVSAETIYATVGTKPVLLRTAIERAIFGPEGVFPDEQSWVARIEHLPTPQLRLRAYVKESCRILARTRALQSVIRGAADQEDAAVQLREDVLRDRLQSNRRLLHRFIGGHLPPGLTLAAAADQYCALSSPELYHVCTVDLGWSAKKHELWLGGMAESALLG
jgi:AcrR family transcriptional regulator